MGELGYPYTKPRGPIGAMYTSPGPIYMLPPLIGDKNHDMRSTHSKAPAYSLAKRIEELGTDRSPGPAAYPQNGKMTHLGMDGSPKYTITGVHEPKRFEVFPGPADYSIDSGVKHVYPSAPAHWMAKRLRDLKTDDTPAPNAYTLPQPSIRSEIQSAPIYTMAGRNDGGVFVTNKNPGPADYTVGNPDLYLHSSPKYTMGITLPEKSKENLPGPATYKSELVKTHLPSTPKFTMGIKHSPYKGEFAIRRDDDF